MKNLLICSLFLITGCGVNFAQGRVIDEATYSEQMRKAGEYRLTENYREKRITESCTLDNCIWKPVSLDITEVDHLGKRRMSIVGTDRGETAPSTVWIFIGNKVYVKRPNMDWQIEESRLTTGINQDSEMIKVEYKDLGTELTGLELNKVLLKTIHSRLSFNGEKSENVQTIKSWIDKTGRLKQQEYLMTSSKGMATRLTMIYEVDPNIKIEAPIK